MPCEQWFLQQTLRYEREFLSRLPVTSAGETTAGSRVLNSLKEYAFNRYFTFSSNRTIMQHESYFIELYEQNKYSFYQCITLTKKILCLSFE